MECDWTCLQPAPYFDLYEGFYLVEDIHYFIDNSGNAVYIEYDDNEDGEVENNGNGDDENGDNEDENNGNGDNDFEYGEDENGDNEDENNGNGDNDFEDIGDGEFEYVPENDDFWNDIVPFPPDIVIQIRG